MDIERYVANKLHEITGITAVLEVPEDRPEEFVSVELNGSPGERFIKNASLTIQSWAKTRRRAADVAATVEKALRQLIAYDEIFGVSKINTYRWPDPESRHQRYQTTVNLTVYTN